MIYQLRNRMKLIYWLRPGAGKLIHQLRPHNLQLSRINCQWPCLLHSFLHRRRFIARCLGLQHLVRVGAKTGIKSVEPRSSMRRHAIKQRLHWQAPAAIEVFGNC